MAGVDELTDQIQHAVDVLRGVRAMIGLADVQAGHLLEVDVLVFPRQLRLGAPLRGRARNDLVFDVGDVANVRDLEPRPFEVPANGIEDDRGPRVPDVGRVVDGRPTHVERDLAGLARRQLDGVTQESVADADHGGSRVVLRLSSAQRDSSSATAQHAMPSERPTAPIPSPRFGFTDTNAPPSAPVRLVAMVSTYRAQRWGLGRDHDVDVAHGPAGLGDPRDDIAQQVQ